MTTKGNCVGGGVVKRIFEHSFDDIILIENLLETWEIFLRGKRHKKDVMDFQLKLFDNLVLLSNDLRHKVYYHKQYQAFNISDPKPRRIHKASVRDRIVHQLVYNTLYDYFDRQFIYDSYSCRKKKGAHKALNRFKYFAGKVSYNHTRTCHVLKCDVKKFFANIDQVILFGILKRQIADIDLLWLIQKVLSSFWTVRQGVGLPLGNLTSQLFSNIYLNELDKYVKQELRVKYYIRYADDFVILSDDKEYLKNILEKIDIFLKTKLKLTLHPNKVFIRTYSSGIDFLGWVHFPYYRQIRTTTRYRVKRGLTGWPKPETINSYRGLLSHGNTYDFRKSLGLG